MKSRWMMSDFLYVSAEEVKDGIIKDVAIVSVGKAKGHNVNINLEFLEAAEKEGNSKKNGIKVRFGHPTMSGNPIGSFLGRASNFKVKDNVLRGDIVLSESAKKDPRIFLGKMTDIRLQNGYVMGKLHLIGTASTTKGQNICDHIIKTTELTTEMLGLCVVFKGQKYQKGYNKKEYKKLSTNKKTYLELEKLHFIYCYDFSHIEEKK